jgi:CRISPR-associated protein (TIGR03986 family)
MIKAPYNFLPLNEKVFYPDWAEKVSHDIPFEDEESGSIDITITAKSPIFIRDHEKQEEFCQHNGNYYIPGSSLKGMVRNIFEILTFSRIQTDNKKFSYRDFNEPIYKNKLLNNSNNIHMGWLRKEGMQWTVEDLGKSVRGSNRIKYEDININNIYKIKNEKLLEKKYALSNFENPELEEGFVVFTGKTSKDKTREFIFPKPNDEHKKYSLEEDSIVVKTFKEAYHIGTINENKLWEKVFSKRLKEGKKIPIFFLTKENRIESFGLSMLYKFPYAHAVHDGIGEHAEDLEKIDMAEVLFGYSKQIKEENVSLKGRVQFSHCVASRVKIFDRTIKKILSSPRAGYYPMYTENGNSYNKKFKISGWKRYPVHKDANLKNDEGNDTVMTPFKPLDKESVFIGKVRFHNLKKVELGALLYTLSLNSFSNELFYSIGMAKPFGLGKIELNYRADKKIDVHGSLSAFEEKINGWLKEEKIADTLKETSQFKELIAMMREKNDSVLRYGDGKEESFKYYKEVKDKRVKRKKYSDKMNLNFSLFTTGQLLLKHKAYEQKIKEDKKREEERETLLKYLPSNKKLKSEIECFVTTRTTLNYLSMQDLNNYLTDKYSDITEDIVNEFERLYDSKAFRDMEALLIQRAKGVISDVDKASLYLKLQEYNKNR